tara:strand:+ start:304 stop:462 length:159 start_codon:yes stop_codon:yes gene_type:complete
MSKRDKKIRVNICWEVGKERKCETLDKNHAYALKKWVDEQNGCVFWFQALED